MIRLLVTAAIIFFNFILIYSQSLSSLELKYEDLEKEFLKESSAVDSLGTLVLRRATAIDNEKKKNDPDEDKIIELMAGSASLSNDLEKHRKKSKKLEDNLEEIKQLLYKKYTVIIDSLQAAKAGGRAGLQEEIFFYTERRLMVSPKIPMLSFNPQKVLKIDLGRIKQTEEKKLFQDYLNNALSEVNTLLVSVENESRELDQIAELEKRTKRFLEDTEFESGVIPRSISRESSQNNQSETESYFNGRGDNAVSNAENVKAYNSLLNQLNTGSMPAQGYNMRSSAAELENMDIEDYQKLLKEVKLRLQELKLVLANKISVK